MTQMKQWTVEQNGETIGVFNTAEDATEYAARVLKLPASVEVDHGDHVRTYLYADTEAMKKDAQGCHPSAVVLPCADDHIPTYRN